METLESAGSEILSQTKTVRNSVSQAEAVVGNRQMLFQLMALLPDWCRWEIAGRKSYGKGWDKSWHVQGPP